MVKILKGISPYVIFFGFFVGVSLLLQCFIPFLQKMVELNNIGYNWGYWLTILNNDFTLPMELISQFWAAIAAAYVGLDRTVFAVDALKHGTNDQEAFSPNKLKQLNQIMWLSFGLYILAVLLNTVFQAELALTPLLACFGSIVLFYVSGNKVVRTMEKVCPEQYEELFIDNNNLKDTFRECCKELYKTSGLTDDDMKTILIVSDLLKKDESFHLKVDASGKIETLRKPK
jgi:hypothetical protein